MSNKKLITKLVLDLDSLKDFGGVGKTLTPVDISPFAFMVISDYSNAWNGFSSIIKLPSKTTLCWELEGLGGSIMMIKVSQIKLIFKLIGCNEDNGKKLSIWQNIFKCSERMFDPENGTLELIANDFSLSEKGPSVLSANIDTIDNIERKYNLTYSIYMNFTDQMGGLGADKQNYYLKIDPLIKNNSNTTNP